MKKLMIASAAAVVASCVFGAALDPDPLTTGFEGTYAKPTQVGGYNDNGESTAPFYWLSSTADATSTAVTLYDGSGVAKPTDGGDKFLNLSTDGSTLWRAFKAQETATAQEPSGGVDVGTATYIDTMVQFTPSEGDTEPTLGGSDKLAIWLKADGATTNLMVRAGYIADNGKTTTTATTYALAGTSTVSADTWYRLTVKSIANCTEAGNTDAIVGFQIYLDGTLLAATANTFDQSYIDIATGTEWGWDPSAATVALMQSKTLFPSLIGPSGLATLVGVGFQGEGKLDNLTFTTTNPLAPATIGFTITVAAGVTPAWSTDGENWTAYQVGAEAPAGTLYIRLTTADGGVKVIEKELSAQSATFDVSDATFGWPEYLGEAIAENTYAIDNLADLTKLQAKCLALGTAGITFKQTADITLSEAFDGIAQRDMKDTLADAKVGTLDDFAAGAFKGTYDGGNFQIKGLILKKGDYIGLFNATYGATIKNLKVSLGNATGWSDSTAGQVGAVLVGVSVNTTIENCQTVVDGTYDTFTATKTAAGFVGFGGHGTVIKDCVNNLNITSSANEKAGGFVACGQAGQSTGSAGIEINGCTNNGNITGNGDKVAALVGFADIKVTLKGTIVAAGAYTSTVADKSVQSVAFIAASGSVVVDDDAASITVPAGYKTISSAVVDGLMFATVSGNTATLVKNSAAVNGANLKVMAAGAPVSLAKVNDSITLDETLATATVTTTAENAYVAGPVSGVYTVTAKVAPQVTVTIDPAIVEWTSSLQLPTPAVTVAGGLAYTGAWDPASITEPEAGVTNTYTYTANVAATDTTLASSGSGTFKVYKPAAPAEEPKIEPGQSSADVPAASADAATNAVVVVAPADAGVDNATYKTYFNLTATQKSEGVWTVTAALDPAKIALEDTVEDVAGDGIAAVLAEDPGKTATATVAAKPGLYYSTSTVTGLAGADWAAGEGDRVLATGNTVNLKITRPASGNACFIKVLVNTTDKPAK